MGFMSARIVHLHPSLFCNLACRHCYSSSGPKLRDYLPLAPILHALSAFREEGYEVLSLSGGEPLLYPELPTLLAAAGDAGYRVNVVTNGAAVGGPLLKLIREQVNVVAVSIDGAPMTHDDLRADPRAFEYARRAIERLADVGKAFGLALCVSRKSLPDVPWVYEFAEEHGAIALQLHPFAAVGRGTQFSAELLLSPSERSRLYVIGELLGSVSGPAVQCDLTPVDIALRRVDDYALLSKDKAADAPLSDLINPLVIDPAGVIRPFAFGTSARYALGNIAGNVPEQVQAFRRANFLGAAELLSSTFERLRQESQPFVDWFFEIAATSHAADRRVLPVAT